jgi:putative sigma-54 modulation protein
MEMLLRTNSGTVPERAKQYAGKKLRRIGRWFNKIGAIEFVYGEEKGRHHVELTVDADGYFVRGADTNTNLFTAIDTSIDKLEKQLRKYRSRIIRHHRSRGVKELPEGFAEFAEAEERMEEEETPRIVERRRLDAKPMLPEEAAFQLDLLGQDFFLFLDSTTDSVSLVYRRPDGIVLIET